MTDKLTASAALAAVPMFSRLSPEVLDALADQTEGRTFGVDDVVATEGAPNDGLLVLTSGVMEVRRGDRLIKVLGPGDSVGYLSLIDGGPHSVDVIVTEGGKGVFLDGAQFRVVIKNQPDVAISVMGGTGQSSQRDSGVARRSRSAQLLTPATGTLGSESPAHNRHYVRPGLSDLRLDPQALIRPSLMARSGSRHMAMAVFILWNPMP